MTGVAAPRRRREVNAVTEVLEAATKPDPFTAQLLRIEELQNAPPD